MFSRLNTQQHWGRPGMSQPVSQSMVIGKRECAGKYEQPAHAHENTQSNLETEFHLKLPEQINRLRCQSCISKRIKAYR